MKKDNSNKLMGLLAILCTVAVGLSFAGGYGYGKVAGIRAANAIKKADTGFIYGTDAHCNISLPEDLQGDNVIAGTLLQIDSFFSDSVIHTSFFNGTAIYGDGSEFAHPIDTPIHEKALFDIE